MQIRVGYCHNGSESIWVRSALFPISTISDMHGFLSVFNILYPKMCSLCGGDFRNQYSVFGLYVMPTHG